MERFSTYLWVEQMPKAEAFWRAKCDLRAGDHPNRNWAAWVLSGEPDREPPRRPGPGIRWALPGLWC